MFVLCLSYTSILHLVSQYCQLPLVWVTTELDHDGTTLYGVQIQLHTFFQHDIPHHLLFWSSKKSTLLHPYENIVFQAILFLQSLYDFSIVDYSYRLMLQHQLLIRHLFMSPNTGSQLTSMWLTNLLGN